MIENGECAYQADLARRLGVSRARVSQVLRFLRLDPKVLKTLTALGDPLLSPIVTERKLKKIINFPKEKQRQRVKKFLDFEK